MLRRARVPVPAATEAVRPRGGPLPKAKEAPTAGALRVLSSAAVDAVLHVFVATLWAYQFAGPVLEILGRWVCGAGSSVEAAGLAVCACSKFVMVLLSPAYITLVVMRAGQHAEFDLKQQEKERREKLAGDHIVTVESVNEQLPKRKAVARPQLPKGVKVPPLFGFLPMMLLQFLAIMMLIHHEKGSVMWRVADVLFDVARLGIGVIAAVWAVPNLVILVRNPKAKDEGDEMRFSLCRSQTGSMGPMEVHDE